MRADLHIIFDVKYAVMVPSARYGFYLLLKAFGIEADDEVIIPGLTYFAIPAMVPLLNAKPVFADIGLQSHVMDPTSFESRITSKTKVVVPTHLFGTPCDMKSISDIAKKHNIKVIEDCAQSTGAKFCGRRVGGWGDAAYYTFGLTKNITTLSGAMITTNDRQIAEFVRTEIEKGSYPNKKRAIKEVAKVLALYVATHPSIYWATVHPAVLLGNKLGKDPIHERFGEPECTYDTLPSYYKEQSKSLAVQAAVGMRQLDRIEELNGSRKRNGRALDMGWKGFSDLGVPFYPDGADPIYMSFVVHHKDRKSLENSLRDVGIDTTIGYMNNMSDHTLFQEYKMDCPNATKANQELLHIPVHPNLSEKDRHYMIQVIREVVFDLGMSYKKFHDKIVQYEEAK